MNGRIMEITSNNIFLYNPRGNKGKEAPINNKGNTGIVGKCFNFFKIFQKKFNFSETFFEIFAWKFYEI